MFNNSTFSLQCQPNSKSLPKATQILAQSLSFFRKKLSLFLGVVLFSIFIRVFLLLFLVVAFIGFPITIKVKMLFLMLVAYIFDSIITGWELLAIGFIIKNSEQPITILEVYYQTIKKIPDYLLIYFLVFLVILAGLILFIIPGIIFTIWFSQSGWVFVFEDIRGIKALVKSREYTRGKWWQVFWRYAFFLIFLIFFFLFLTLISLLLFKNSLPKLILKILAFFLFTPLAAIYSILIYLNLKNIKKENSSANQVYIKEARIITAGIFCFLIILGLIFLKKQLKPLPLDCSQNERKKFAKLITKNLKKNDYYLQIRNDEFSHTAFVFKRNYNEPYITYPGYYIELILRESKRDYADKLLSNLIKLFKRNSFTKDVLNDVYVKNNMMYKIRVKNFIAEVNPSYNDYRKFTFISDENKIDLKFIKSLENQGKIVERVRRIEITCGIKSKKFDEIYDEILETGIIKETIKNYNTDNNLVIGISKIHKNRIFALGVFTIDKPGGESLWLYKDINSWKEIYRGQFYPDCAILEKLGIEPGVDCEDATIPSKRFLRKTK